MTIVDERPGPERQEESRRWTDRIGHLLGLIRFSHTIFALPFAALASVMAITTPLPGGVDHSIGGRHLLGVLFCMIFARSVAMAFNRLVDQPFDARNPRTASRHLPAGILQRGEVWLFTSVCIAGFVASTLLFLPNRVPLYGAIPVLCFLCGYSLAKRFTAAVHLWLGIALALSPICVWLALRGWVSMSDLTPALFLAGAIAAWVTGFDIIYACQDAEFDATIGLHSVPAKLGIARALRLAAIAHLITVVILAALPFAAPQTGLGLIYLIAVTIVAGLLWYQHRLVSPSDLKRVNEAFFNVNAIISLLLLVAGGLDCVF